MMFIDFGANDPNINISGVEFESVNAIIVDQTTRLGHFSKTFLTKVVSGFWLFDIVNSIMIYLWYQKSTCKDDHMTPQMLEL